MRRSGVQIPEAAPQLVVSPLELGSMLTVKADHSVRARTRPRSMTEKTALPQPVDLFRE